MAPPKSRKKSLGRQKIEMKFIEDENARTVTFSKRRAGLFKKATELSIVCGTQIALVIFSLCGRAYSFGHPSVDSVLARFLRRNHAPTLQDSDQGRTIHSAMIQELNDKFEKTNEELNSKKRRGKELEAALENSPCRISEERLRRLNIHQLMGLKQMMEKLREKVQGRINVLKSKNVAEAAKDREKVIDLSKVERDGCGDSPIPPDWLKL